MRLREFLDLGEPAGLALFWLVTFLATYFITGAIF